jgi:hypothetical protein
MQRWEKRFRTHEIDPELSDDDADMNVGYGVYDPPGHVVGAPIGDDADGAEGNMPAGGADDAHGTHIEGADGADPAAAIAAS